MSDETAPQPRIKTAWLLGTLAALALFVVIGAYSSRMTWDYPDYEQQRADERKVTLATVQKAENALIDPVDAQGHPTAEWIDQAKGTVRIPIEEAMARELDTLKGQPPAMGAVIPAPAPPAPAKAATAAKPPTAGAPSAGATNAAPAPTAGAPSAGAPSAGVTNAAPATATPPPAKPDK